MKKFLVTLLAAMLAVSMVACGSKNPTTETVETTPAVEEIVSDGTLGQDLLVVFADYLKANPEATTQELADAVITNEKILFMGGSMPVEEGFLMGFNADITGFEEAVNFMPMIGTIPFMGYVFSLADGADVDAFIATLEANADPRWNICTAADQTVIKAIGNKVFFLMCPTSLEG